MISLIRSFFSLFFVRSGYVNPANSSAYRYQDTGGYGYDWSSAPGSNGTAAYDLVIGPAGSGTTVDPSNLNSRCYGFPLRCLAR